MNGKIGKIIIAAICSIVMVFGLVVFIHEQKRGAIAIGFENLDIGDSRAKVLESLGQPDEIEVCVDRKAEDPLNKACVEQFWYKRFIERWGVSFDSNGRVIHKSYNALY